MSLTNPEVAHGLPLELLLMGRADAAMQDMTKSLNVVKSIKDSMGKHSFMARCRVPVRQFYDQPGQTVDSWYELGKNPWWDEEGTVGPPAACHTFR